MAIKILFSAQLPLKLTKRKKWVVASCPILDVRSQGETEEKAKAYAEAVKKTEEKLKAEAEIRTKTEAKAQADHQPVPPADLICTRPKRSE